MPRANQRWSGMLLPSRETVRAERRARCVFTRTYDPNLGGGAAQTALEEPRDRMARGWHRPLRFAVQSAVALLAPAECRVCALPLVRATRYPICAACLDGLQPSPFAGCARCGEALAMESAMAAGLSRTDEVLCDACTTERPLFVCATACGDYGGSLRTLIHLHKFEGMRSLSGPLGAKLATAMERACAGAAGPLHVVAVPLYRNRRQYNQSALMADAAVEHLRTTRPGLQIRSDHGLLKRTRHTESQTHLSPRQRRLNVQGAFEAGAGARGLHLVLVDDVYTTGATVAECTAVLLAAGAASVRVATLARTQPQLAAVWQPAGVAAQGGQPFGKLPGNGRGRETP